MLREAITRLIESTDEAASPSAQRFAALGETPQLHSGFVPQPQSFAEVVELFGQHKEAQLRTHLFNNAHLVRFEQGRIELRPANSRMKPIVVGEGDLQIQGVVIGLIRKFR